MASSTHSSQTSWENGAPVAKFQRHEMEFNRVNCLVWVLHESASSFSHAVENLQLSGTGPALAMAWAGKDVHDWHKRIAYQVCLEVYAYPSVNKMDILNGLRDNLVFVTNITFIQLVTQMWYLSYVFAFA